MLALTIAYMVAETVGGFLTNSLALLSDAGHMLTDVAALSLAMLALWFAARPATHKKTYGYYRMEILAALANGVALVVISLVIFYEAIGRTREPQPVRGLELTLIAAGGLAVNAVSALLLRSASRGNLNIRGALLHVLSDLLGSVAALSAGIVIWQWGWTPIDPIIGMLMCLLIIYNAWQLIKESVNILLEGTPSHIDILAVISAMHEVDDVVDVHDLHVWTISSGKEALSAHVTIGSGAPHKQVLDALRGKLSSDFNIGHVTLQLEPPEDEDGRKLYQIVRRSNSEANATSSRGSSQSAAARDGKD